jgi:hypothetical protein
MTTMPRRQGKYVSYIQQPCAGRINPNCYAMSNDTAQHEDRDATLKTQTLQSTRNSYGEPFLRTSNALSYRLTQLRTIEADC